MSTQYKATAGSSMAVSAPAYVRAAIKTVGNEETTNGHPKHKFISNLTAFGLAFLGPKSFSRQMMKFNLGLKTKGAKKVAPLTGESNNKV